jgi:hypothetical protein
MVMEMPFDIPTMKESAFILFAIGMILMILADVARLKLIRFLASVSYLLATLAFGVHLTMVAGGAEDIFYVCVCSILFVLQSLLLITEKKQ